MTTRTPRPTTETPLQRFMSHILSCARVSSHSERLVLWKRSIPLHLRYERGEYPGVEANPAKSSRTQVQALAFASHSYDRGARIVEEHEAKRLHHFGGCCYGLGTFEHVAAVHFGARGTGIDPLNRF